jgi:hypothetical protein
MVPFASTVSTSPERLGFVWEATLSFLPKSWWSVTESVVKVRVCDALVNGRSYLTARPWGILTLSHKESSISKTNGLGGHNNDDLLLYGERLKDFQVDRLLLLIHVGRKHVLPDDRIESVHFRETGRQKGNVGQNLVAAIVGVRRRVISSNKGDGSHKSP